MVFEKVFLTHRKSFQSTFKLSWNAFVRGKDFSERNKFDAIFCANKNPPQYLERHSERNLIKL